MMLSLARLLRWSLFSGYLELDKMKNIDGKMNPRELPETAATKLKMSSTFSTKTAPATTSPKYIKVAL